MDSQQLLERISPFVKKNFLILSLGIVGLTFFIYGLIALLGEASSSADVVFEAGSDSKLGDDLKTIAVDIEGAVMSPGVYDIKFNSRIQDALIAAKGLSEDADRAWVAKNMNLAQKITDGQKIYIPKIEDSVAAKTLAGNDNGISSQININSASVHELDGLSGIGPVTAQKIIDNRPYSNVDELLSKKVVGSKAFEQIKEKITVF